MDGSPGRIPIDVQAADFHTAESLRDAEYPHLYPNISALLRARSAAWRLMPTVIRAGSLVLVGPEANSEISYWS